MNSTIYYTFVFCFLLACELLYFSIAQRYGIVDRPNNRSSHGQPTIRGGGIIFVLAVIVWFVSHQAMHSVFFVVGLVMLAVISFIDDLRGESRWLRITIHVFAFGLAAFDSNLFNYDGWIVIAGGLVFIAAINAFNFMDGINGISGIYALVSLVTFLVIDRYVIDFVDSSLLITVIFSVVVFLFFNFRVKARCFAGDVGSVTLAFVQLFVMVLLIVKTANPGWISLFLVFGVDSLVTILYRIRWRENILVAHRTHLYQYLSNELKVSHLVVSLGYGLLQILINIFFILFMAKAPLWSVGIFFLVVGLLYVMVRERVLYGIDARRLFSGRLPSDS